MDCETFKLLSNHGKKLKTFHKSSDVVGLSLSSDSKMLPLYSINGTGILKNLYLDNLLVLGYD